MSPLLPSNSSCYNLHLPLLDTEAARNMDESTIKRMTLDARTGAAIVLARSAIYVHGGLVLPLNLQSVQTSTIQQELIMHFARERKDSNRFENLRQWISKETFYLDLISRKWDRIPTTLEREELEEESDDLRERLFHSLCYSNGDLYLFGGLTTSLQSEYELNATNELWKLSLSTKIWSLVSADPSISRRFNHQMHVLHQYDDDKDTKLIVVGGLNNFDKPVHKIDVYNLVTGKWESYDHNIPSDNLRDLNVNIDGVPTALVSENNFSILVEDNEANLPTLAFYSSNMCSSGCPQKRTQNSGTEHEYSPLFALPLLNNTEGAHMSAYKGGYSNKRRLNIAYNLKWPMGEKFGYNFVISGFYPDCQSSSLHVFLYNITSKKWTRLNINCDDINMFKHRFWKLLLWESHHKALLLGTKSDEGSLPSVQKFDHLVSIGLQMSNIFHSAQSENKGVRAEIFKRPQSSSVQTEIEQFEKYSKYVAPPSEITSIRSVFPSHSMVLGKDSLDVYNKLIADFEFITEDGEHISVPSFLLRKRWGRFFDKLLANAYVQVNTETNLSDVHSRVVKLSSAATSDSGGSPRVSGSTGSLQKDGAKPTSQGSLDAFFSRTRHSTQSNQTDISPSERKTASLFIDSVSREVEDNLNVVKQPNENTGSSAFGPVFSTDAEKSLSRRDSVATGVTSSSGGMIFRVPFRSSVESSKKSTPPPPSYDPSDSSCPSKAQSSNRRKFSSGSFSSHSNEDIMRNSISQSRKPSNPTGNDALLHPNFGFTSPTPSRKASIASASSSISHVSSNSDRAGEPIYKTISSEDALYLNIALPPQQPLPGECLPPIPSHSPSDHNFSKRFSELLTIEAGRFRGIASPLASRRSSLHQDITLPLSQENINANKIDEVFQDPPRLRQSDQKYSPLTQVQHDRSSFISSPDSINSQSGSVMEVDFEPLLIPRAFYMPWPAETVKAFAEFFYTGQIDGKWPLSPVTIGLFHMAKLYEVPLLLDLILEVFYSIIGKKEESLLLISRSLKDAFLSRVYAFFEDDDANIMNEYLENNKNYQEYLRIENSLNCIDDGYFDMENLRKASAAFSVETSSSSAACEYMEKLPSSDLPTTPSLVPTIFADSPRGSINSNSSMYYPLSTNLLPSGKKSSITQLQQRMSKNPKHKSSLSKEVSKEDNYVINSPSDSPCQLSPTCSAQMNTIDDELDQVEKTLDNPSKKSDSSDSASSSDFDDMDAGLGFLSRSKIEKSFKERALDLEESVDPLSRITSESVPSLTKKSHFLSKFKGHEHQLLEGERLATLDSLASSNSLPPVDYIMELIYEAAVLINDVKLMVRCMDCIQISKCLKSCKKNLTGDFAALDEILSKNRKDSQRPVKKPSTPDSFNSARSTDPLAKSISSSNFGSFRSKSSK